MFDRLGDSELDLHPSESFDLAVVARDGEAARDDVVEVNHGSGDDVRPFGVWEWWCLCRIDERRLGELEVSGESLEQPESGLEAVSESALR